MDPIYFTDNYPREGCTLAVNVQANRYVLSVLAPGGKVIETYAAKTPRQLARMIEEWCAGWAPRLNSRLDQVSCGSTSTLNT